MCTHDNGTMRYNALCIFRQMMVQLACVNTPKVEGQAIYIDGRKCGLQYMLVSSTQINFHTGVWWVCLHKLAVWLQCI